MTVINYVNEEVRRQGHDTHVLDGIERAGWMLDAWSYALRELPRQPVMGDAITLGQLVERQKNEKGIRDCAVRVGRRICPAPELVSGLLADLFRRRDELSPLEFYKAFEEVHPFEDGNGRTGKILMNWKAGTLLKPWFPPSDLWGQPIRNP